MQDKQNFHITAHNYDIVFKESLSIFKNKTLDFLNLNLPPISDFVKTEFCEIETHDTFCDLVFWLADGSILHIEEETDLSRSDTIRFAMYDLQILKQYNVAITTLVFTLKTPKIENVTLHTNNLQYKLLIKYMSIEHADAKLQELREKIINKQPINELELIFLPLMHTNKPRFEIVKQAIELIKDVVIDKLQHEKIAASILVLANKFLSKEQMEQMWEVIRMYKFIEIAEEKGIEKGMEIGLEKGMEIGKIELLTRMLLKKFNFNISDECLRKIKALPEAKIDILALSLFEMNDVDDLEKYLH